MGDWYKSGIEQVAATLETAVEEGLSSEEAGRRLKQYGLNELIEKGTKSPLAHFVGPN